MKKNKFDFTQKKMTVFQKFIGFLNEVTDEVKEIEKLSDADETESGEVSLKYAVDDDKYYEVDAEGFVYGVDGEKLTDGEYPLLDGSVLKVTDGKFDGTIVKEDAKNDDAKEEAPIAQEEDEKKSDEDVEGKDDEKEDEDPNKSKDDKEDVAQEDEEKAEEDKEDAEKGDDEKAKEEEETAAKEDEIEQEGEVVPFLVNGVEYMLPIEVVDYINSLTSTSEVFRKEIAQIKQRIPSTKPSTTAPIKQKETPKVNLYDQVNMFRR